MKNIYPKNLLVICISFFSIFAFIFSCKKISQLLTFTISNECDITINSSSPVNLPFNIASPEVATNSSQEFENNNTKANLVKDIRLDKLQLTITNPANQTFEFIKSIHIYISTNASNEIELAYLDDISSSATTIELIPTEAKLDEYVKSSSYSLRTAIVNRQIVTKNIDIHINAKFKVSANL